MHSRYDSWEADDVLSRTLHCVVVRRCSHHNRAYSETIQESTRPCKGGTLSSELVRCGAADSSIIAPGAQLEKLGEGYSATEGPAADRDGNVFFTDHPNDRIVKWNAADGKFSDWLKPAGRSNGTYFDKAGNLLAAAAEKGELWSIAPDKKVTVLATNFGGKLFNGPNDLWIRPDGGLYFTDPFYYEVLLVSRPRDADSRPKRVLHGARPQDYHTCHERH